MQFFFNFIILNIILQYYKAIYNIIKYEILKFSETVFKKKKYLVQ